MILSTLKKTPDVLTPRKSTSQS